MIRPPVNCSCNPEPSPAESRSIWRANNPDAEQPLVPFLPQPRTYEVNDAIGGMKHLFGCESRAVLFSPLRRRHEPACPIAAATYPASLAHTRRRTTHGFQIHSTPRCFHCALEAAFRVYIGNIKRRLTGSFISLCRAFHHELLTR